MNEFTARNPKQLDLCLRMLYSEKIPFAVTIKETDKLRIEYVIRIETDHQMYEVLKERYRILIS